MASSKPLGGPSVVLFVGDLEPDVTMVESSDEEDEPDDFAELFSAPRVSFSVQRRGLLATLALDLKSGYDFVSSSGRGDALRMLALKKPRFIMISPPCTLFSILQKCFRNFEKMDPAILQKRWDEAMVMLDFGAMVAQHQLRNGQFFAFEHPAGATSWSQPSLQALANDPRCFSVDFDQCQVCLRCPKTGKLIKKRTRLLSNAPLIKDIFAPLQCKCTSPHAHIEGSVNGMSLSVFCQHYPAEFCEKLAEAVQLTVRRVER